MRSRRLFDCSNFRCCCNTDRLLVPVLRLAAAAVVQAYERMAVVQECATAGCFQVVHGGDVSATVADD